MKNLKNKILKLSVFVLSISVLTSCSKHKEVSEADAVLKHALAKPIIPLNLTESEINNLDKNIISENDVKDNLTH